MWMGRDRILQLIDNAKQFGEGEFGKLEFLAKFQTMRIISVCT